MPAVLSSRAEKMLAALAVYRAARLELLSGLRPTNRDPLAEWSEHFVAELLGGVQASNPVQKGWDIQVGLECVQVRYLANTADHPWVNWHDVTSLPGVDRYALMILEMFVPLAVLVFPSDLTAICAALGKRHPNQERLLRLTEANYRAVVADPERFRSLGMQIFMLGNTGTGSD